MSKEILFSQLELFATGNEHSLSRLCSMIAALYWSDERISWAGIYYLDSRTGSAWLGPFQGFAACMTIAPGAGVIQASIREQRPLVVDNVLTFEGHIACDARSRSEMVIPLGPQNRPLAVLDLDSDEFDHFSTWSKEEIQRLQELFTEVLQAGDQD